MASLFDREWILQLGDIRVRGLRLKFKVEKSTDADPNALDLHVYNLADTTRALLQARGMPVVLVAGYKSDAQVIFAGDARFAESVRDGAGWDTHIQSGDGEAAFGSCFTSRAFGPGTSWKAVAASIFSDLKVNSGDALAKLQSGDFQGAFSSFVSGYSAHGPTVREMDRLMNAAGLEWSIQDGTLQILQPGKASEERAILLSRETGLVGSPDHGSPQKDGSPARLRARSLLQGGLRPGRAVELQSERVRGFYRCEKVVHEGDTHGGEWYSSVDLIPL